MSSKAIHCCRECGKGIRAMAGDPVVAARSLGLGFYHYDCARIVWAREQGLPPPVVDTDTDPFAFLEELDDSDTAVPEVDVEALCGRELPTELWDDDDQVCGCDTGPISPG